MVDNKVNSQTNLTATVTSLLKFADKSTENTKYGTKPLAKESEYQALIAMAEIGYLSGFKEKLVELKKHYYLPAVVDIQLKAYIELCNFPAIIQYLNELKHE